MRRDFLLSYFLFLPPPNPVFNTPFYFPRLFALVFGSDQQVKNDDRQEGYQQGFGQGSSVED